jgi:hypothetical protein
MAWLYRNVPHLGLAVLAVRRDTPTARSLVSVVGVSQLELVPLDAN